MDPRQIWTIILRSMVSKGLDGAAHEFLGGFADMGIPLVRARGWFRGDSRRLPEPSFLQVVVATPYIGFRRALHKKRKATGRRRIQEDCNLRNYTWMSGPGAIPAGVFRSLIKRSQTQEDNRE